MGDAAIPKLVYLEAIRGCAAVVVVLTHFASAFFPYSVFGSDYKAHGYWEALFITTPLGIVLAAHFAVCLFFILSGYVLSLPYFGPSAKNAESIQAAIVKRPIRLGGLVLLTALLSLLLSHWGWFFNGLASSTTGSIPWFSAFFSQDIPNLKHLLADFAIRLFSATHRYNPPLWTIELELYGSFLTYAFLLLFRTSRMRYLAYAAALVLLTGTLYHGFLFGILLADVAKSFPNFWSTLVRPRVSIPMLIAGILFASFPSYVKNADLTNTFYSVFPQIRFLGGGYGMLGAVLVFTATLLNPTLQALLSRRIFAYVGRISFALYAVHFLILCSFSSWLFIQLEPALGYALTCLLVAVSYLLFTWILAHWMTVYFDEPTTRLANKCGRIYLDSLHPQSVRYAVTFEGTRQGSPVT